MDAVQSQPDVDHVTSKPPGKKKIPPFPKENSLSQRSGGVESRWLIILIVSLAPTKELLVTCDIPESKTINIGVHAVVKMGKSAVHYRFPLSRDIGSSVVHRGMGL